MSSRSDELRDAIVELARAKAPPGQAVNLLNIGPTLVTKMNFDQDEVVNTLYAMQEGGLIRLLEGNRIIVVARGPDNPRVGVSAQNFGTQAQA